MIKLTRLNGEEFVVNAELIRFVESRPDTYVTLTSNERLIVRESICGKSVPRDHKRRLLVLRSKTSASRTNLDVEVCHQRRHFEKRQRHRDQSCTAHQSSHQ